MKLKKLIYNYFKKVVNIKFIILYKTIILYDIYLKLIYSYFKEVINIKFIILYKTKVLYDIYLKLIYISILLNL